MVDETSLTGDAVVIGAGTMGGGIAAQLANAGWRVSLLDVADSTSNQPEIRNRAAHAGLDRLRNSRPPLLFLPEFAERIRVGNVEDDREWLRDADWIVEAVAEKRDVKRSVMAIVEASCGPQSVVSSNTSGLSLADMISDCGPEFQSRFLGTHFLNPPRYLKLLEIVALPTTDPVIATGFVRFAEGVLGHRVVMAKDTPGFISTRIWIEHLLETIRLAVAYGLTVEEVDYLTGPLIGRPKSATFRMADLVGLDILADIARNQVAALSQDPFREQLRVPEVIEALVADGRTGEKVGAGFYKREGKEILSLDFASLRYRPRNAEELNPMAKLPLMERFAALRAQGSRQAQFLNAVLDSLEAYVGYVGPEVAADVASVDNVMMWGFGWELGPFAIADLRRTEDASVNYGGTPGERRVRVFGMAELQTVPDQPEVIFLAERKATGKTVLECPEGSLVDLDDGVVCLEFRTKMNTFNPALTAFVHVARERAERDFAGLVIGNQAAHFSAGYDLGLLLRMAVAQEWEAILNMMRDVQGAILGLQYARVPVVTAPHGFALGAGCEVALQSAANQAVPELVMGLPEVGAGVVPSGGGMKQLLWRSMAGWDGVADIFGRVEAVFEALIRPRNSASAAEARKMGLLSDKDGISRNADRQLYEAKQRVMQLGTDGYLPPEPKRIWIGGPEILARLRFKIHGAYRAGLLTSHDRRIADAVAFVLSGGDLPYAQWVSEDYLMRLEREALVSLIQTPETQARMEHILKTGKPLRN